MQPETYLVDIDWNKYWESNQHPHALGRDQHLPSRVDGAMKMHGWWNEYWTISYNGYGYNVPVGCVTIVSSK